MAEETDDVSVPQDVQLEAQAVDPANTGSADATDSVEHPPLEPETSSDNAADCATLDPPVVDATAEQTSPMQLGDVDPAPVQTNNSTAVVRGGGPARGVFRGRGTTRGTGRARGASRGRGRGRGRGRARGHGRGSTTTAVGADNHPQLGGWTDEDSAGGDPPTFTPVRPAGIHLPGDFIITKDHEELDFFQLFFSQQVLERIANATNEYAWRHIVDTPAYGDRFGAWEETTAEEIRKVLGQILYMSIVRLPKVEDYYRITPLFHGLWARAFIASRNRFKALMSFLHLTTADEETEGDRLRKVRWLHDHLKNTCRKYFQPDQRVSIDERMIRMKGRSILKQYMPNKPTKWGVKLFAACDVASSYMFDLDVYTGTAIEGQGEVGLTQTVVTRVMNNYRDQHYIVFTDNYYTSPALATALKDLQCELVGTLRTNRTGVPAAIKDAKQFEKDSPRGAMRYTRSGTNVFIQWKDKRAVTMLSTYHKGSDHIDIERNTKEGGQHVVVHLKQPRAIHDYNHGMGGVDTFDSMCASYKVSRRSKKYWKAMFYDFLEIASVNSMILFQLYRRNHANAIPRSATYDHMEFRVALVRQLGSIARNAPVPLYQPTGAVLDDKVRAAAKSHMPIATATRRNCHYCYLQESVERKCNVKCTTCNKYFHITELRDCFHLYHESHL